MRIKDLKVVRDDEGVAKFYPAGGYVTDIAAGLIALRRLIGADFLCLMRCEFASDEMIETESKGGRIEAGWRKIVDPKFLMRAVDCGFFARAYETSFVSWCATYPPPDLQSVVQSNGGFDHVAPDGWAAHDLAMGHSAIGVARPPPRWPLLAGRRGAAKVCVCRGRSQMRLDVVNRVWVS